MQVYSWFPSRLINTRVSIKFKLGRWLFSSRNKRRNNKKMLPNTKNAGTADYQGPVKIEVTIRGRPTGYSLHEIMVFP